MPVGIKDSTLNVVIKARNEAGRVLNDFNKQAGRSVKAGTALSGAVQGIGIAAGAMSVKLGVDAVNMAVKFEKQMANVATLVDTNKENMEAMKDELLDVSKRVPVGIDELTASLYSVRSAGIAAEGAMDVLEQSAVLATTGLGTTEEATDLLTTAMNAFGKSGDEADEVANILFETVKAGKTTVGALTQSFGKMAGNASAAGIKLEDVQAATAALTTVTGKTSESQNALAQVFLELTQEGGKLDKALREQGGSLTALNSAITEDGLIAGMEAMRDELGMTDTEFKNMFSSAEGGTAVFQLLTSANEAAKSTLDDFNDGVSEMNSALEKQEETVEAQAQLLKNQFNTVLIELGTEILPLVNEGLRGLNELLGATNIEKESQAINDLADSTRDLINKKKELQAEGKSTERIDRAIESSMQLQTGLAEDLKPRGTFSFGEQDKGKMVGGLFGNLLGFADGGVVPGPKGAPTLAMVHGGETITPPDQTAGVTINMDLRGATVTDETIIRRVKESINRENQLKFQGA